MVDIFSFPTNFSHKSQKNNLKTGKCIIQETSQYIPLSLPIPQDVLTPSKRQQRMFYAFSFMLISPEEKEKDEENWKMLLNTCGAEIVTSKSELLNKIQPSKSLCFLFFEIRQFHI